MHSAADGQVLSEKKTFYSSIKIRKKVRNIGLGFAGTERF